jgi:hypothetical protein
MKHMVWKLDIFPFSGERKEPPTVLSPLQNGNVLRSDLSKKPSKIGISLLSPEEGNLYKEEKHYCLRPTNLYSIWNKEQLFYQWKESIIVPVRKMCDKTGCNMYLAT